MNHQLIELDDIKEESFRFNLIFRMNAIRIKYSSLFFRNSVKTFFCCLAKEGAKEGGKKIKENKCIKKS